MHIKLSPYFLIGCFLSLGFIYLALDYAHILSSSQEDIIAEVDNENLKQLRLYPQTNNPSFFEIFTEDNTALFQEPDLDISNTGPGGYATEIQNGVKTFIRRTNSINFTGTFQFFDPNQDAYPSGTTFSIEWGDGSPNSSVVEDHEYEAGLYDLTYTVIFPDGTLSIQEFVVFVGPEPSRVSASINNSAQCIQDDLNFTVVIENNTPGTTYTIEINDGSAPIILNSSDYEIGEKVLIQLTHNFLSNSCDVEDFEYEIKSTSTNPGDTSGKFEIVGPIRVSEPTDSSFSKPSEVACINSTLNFNDTTFSGVNTSAEGCNEEYGRYWEISPSTGFTIQDGSVFGNNNGNEEDWTSWNNGSENIVLTFNETGTYQITLVTRNNCGESRVTQEVCIISEVISEFDTGSTEYCIDDTENLILAPENNTTIDADCDIELTYEWIVSTNDEERCTPEPDWEFVNNTNSESRVPEFQFNAPGIYNIQLKVIVENIFTNSGSEDCSISEFTETVIIKEEPRASELDKEACVNFPFNISPDILDCYSTQGVSYEWDFSSSSAASIQTSTDPNPEISYDTPGEYTYELTVSNECGTNVYNGNISIYPEPQVEISNEIPLEICANNDILLEGTILGGTGEGFWTASEPGGSFEPDNRTIDASYTPPDEYLGPITLTLNSDNSDIFCGNVQDDITIEILEGPTADTGSYDPFCVNDVVSLEGSFGGTTSFIEWSSDFGTFEDVTDPTTEFTPPTDFLGVITLTMTAEDEDPDAVCRINTKTVEIEFLPFGGEVIPVQNLELCSTELSPEITFNTNNTFPTNYEWEIDEEIGLAEQSGSDTIPIFEAENLTREPIVATVTVTPYSTPTISDALGCPGNPMTFTITVNPKPIVEDITIELCNGDDLVVDPFEDGTVPSGTAYTWGEPIVEPAGSITGLTAENSPQPRIDLGSIVNTFDENATIIIPVTPEYEGCIGETFDLIVNVETIGLNDERPFTFIEICERRELEALSINYEVEEGSNTSVQWYTNDFATNTGGEPIPGATDTTYQPFPINTAGTYFFYIEIIPLDDNCVDTVSKVFEVEVFDDPILEVNNYISVNENDKNDRLRISGVERIPDNEMKIFNRYGKLVWETKTYNNTDNVFKGASNVGGTINQANFLPTGTYYYVLSYRSNCREEDKKGFLQIDNTK